MAGRPAACYRQGMDDMTGGDGGDEIRRALGRRSGRGPLEEILRLLGSPADEYRRHAAALRRRTNWERGSDPHKSGEPDERPGFPLSR
jgi:hypothetical protein